jgi:membrane associated rhomboid family serine protease
MRQRSSPTAVVRDGARALVADVKVKATVVGSTLALLWTIHVVNALIFGGALAAYGVHPLTIDGLWGILFAPLLHGSFGHLLNNSVAFLWLGPMTMMRRTRDIVSVSVIGAIVAGLGAWVFGGIGTVHIGFSGVIFAYLGFLLTRGVFERSFGGIAISALSTFWFGSMIVGVLPLTPGVSWQGHLFGFIGGVMSAWILARRPSGKKRR